MGVHDRYRDLIAQGVLRHDPVQDAVAVALDQTLACFRQWRFRPFWDRLPWMSQEAPHAGLYLHGSVGRGKSLLMDLAVEEARRLDPSGVQRWHYHAFMRRFHMSLRDVRDAMKTGRRREGDPLPLVVEHLSDGLHLLCLDEFMVYDIADAMLLGRLFERLFDKGVMVITTSNVAPQDLYKDGLNRTLFLPFINLFANKMRVFSLAEGEDYRLNKLRDEVMWRVVESPSSGDLRDLWQRLTGQSQTQPLELDVMGRYFHITASSRGVAWMSFSDLCEAPLGSQDYLALAECHDTLLLEAVPQLGADNRHSAARFITLVDALYDLRVKLFATSVVALENLFVLTSGTEAFTQKRTLSRLYDMASLDYLASAHGSSSFQLGADTAGLVET